MATVKAAKDVVPMAAVHAAKLLMAAGRPGAKQQKPWLTLLAGAGLLLAAICIPWPAAAQALAQSSPEHPFEVYVRGGLGTLYDDEGSLGSGASVSGGFTWQPSPRWGLGVEIEDMGNERDGFAGGFIEGDGLMGAAVAHLYLLPESTHQIYLAGGVGVLQYRRRQFLPDVTIDGVRTDLFRDDTETTLGWRGALGARFNLHPRWTLRAEGSFFCAETEVVEAPFAWLQLSAGIGFRF